MLKKLESHEIKHVIFSDIDNSIFVTTDSGMTIRVHADRDSDDEPMAIAELVSAPNPS